MDIQTNNDSRCSSVPVQECRSFGDTLRVALSERGISQSKCAKMLSIGAGRVNGWIRGTQFPTRKDCQRLGRLLAMAEFAKLIPAKPRKPREVKIRGSRVYTLAEYAAR